MSGSERDSIQNVVTATEHSAPQLSVQKSELLGELLGLLEVFKAEELIALDQSLNDMRQLTIEHCAELLEKSYPDNINTNAFCAAIRSLKVHSVREPS